MLGFIRKIYKDRNELTVVLKLSAVFLSSFLLYLIANYFIIYFLSLSDIKTYLSRSVVNVASDFEYGNGKWNTERYLADISTPTEIPLYIYTTDGFLMDRINVVHGLLDTSNFDYASSFKQPTTIVSPAGETWRASSRSIDRNGQNKGVILVAHFEPKGIPTKEVDAKLQEMAVMLDSKIQLIGDSLDVSKVNQKDVDANISFEIVDTFNRSLMSVGGAPAFIDKSYVQDALSFQGFRKVYDGKTHIPYLVYSKPITSNNETIGVVVAGKGLDQLEKTLGYQLWFSLIAGIVAILLFVIMVVYLYRHDISDVVQERMDNLANPAPPEINSVAFDKDKGMIVINNDIHIQIPVNSHQHDICRRLFQSPNKKLDTMDLGDAIGDQNTGKSDVRTVYDAVLSINEKVKKVLRVQLIVRKENQYCINPEIASKICK